ncbi:MAG: putative iron-regulated protein [Planctomycetota bacterium]
MPAASSDRDTRRPSEHPSARPTTRRPARGAPRASLALAAVTAAATLLAAGGCATRAFEGDPTLSAPSGAVLPAEPSAPRRLAMFEGSTGRVLTWADLMAAASRADAVFVGERHDDPVAHAVQLAIYEELVAGYPGTAIALEHLERNEQPTVDRYLRGEITPDEFIDGTASRNWAGKDTWVPFFQPLVDTARENGAPVVAANAPRDLVRRARSEGHAAMAALPAPEGAWITVPVVERTFDDSWNERWQAYQERFREIMSGADDDLDDPEVRARLDGVFLAQSSWDGTMGDSAARALDAGAPKVVLCAGCFHIERDGGTVLQFEARRPRARFLTVTVIDDASRTLRDEHRGAADIVVYGFPVERKPREESAEGETEGETEGKAEGAPDAPTDATAAESNDNPAPASGDGSL